MRFSVRLSKPAVDECSVGACFREVGMFGFHKAFFAFVGEGRFVGSSTGEFQHCDGKALKVGGMQRLVALVLTITSNVQGASLVRRFCPQSM